MRRNTDHPGADLTMEDAEIVRPCPAEIPHLSPDEARRFCATCSEDVHNLSAMTRGEAQEFLDAHNDRDVCVSYTADEVGRIENQRERRVGFRPWLLGLGALGLITQAGCDPLSAFVSEVSELFTPKKKRVRKVMGRLYGSGGKRKSKRKAKQEAATKGKAGGKGGRTQGSIAGATQGSSEDEACVEYEIVLDSGQ